MLDYVIQNDVSLESKARILRAFELAIGLRELILTEPALSEVDVNSVEDMLDKMELIALRPNIGESDTSETSSSA